MASSTGHSCSVLQFSLEKLLKFCRNKKVLLRERKRTTAHRVASACSAVLSRRGMGVPQSQLEVPQFRLGVLIPGGTYPSLSWG